MLKQKTWPLCLCCRQVWFEVGLPFKVRFGVHYFIDTESFTMSSNVTPILCHQLLCLEYHVVLFCWQCVSLCLSDIPFVAWIRLPFATHIALNNSSCPML